MHKIILNILLLLLPTVVVIAQPHEILRSFNAIQTEQFIRLDWVIKNGQTCDGIQIYRSNDALYFEKIGAIPGICGSSSSEISYSFIDSNPEPNAINYYRLQLGAQGFSDFIGVEYRIYEGKNWNILQNPIVSEAKLIFKNPDYSEYVILIADIQGRVKESQKTTRDFFDISKDALSPGTYIIIARKEGQVQFTQKIIVL